MEDGNISIIKIKIKYTEDHSQKKIKDYSEKKLTKLKIKN